MYNIAEDPNKSSELIPFVDLQNLKRIGFKLVPLRQDYVTPNVLSTNEIYNDPEFWSDERLRKDHHRFYGVATLLGKSHIKDETGNDLYLNVIDIDSDAGLTKLSTISKNGKDISLIDELRQSTYVVKTRKRSGYHVYWFSHNQNKPIRTSDCKPGFEFEIKTDNCTGHSTLPPSGHRNELQFHYQNVGQNTIATDDKLYSILVDLLIDFIKEKSPLTNCCIKRAVNEPTNEITTAESSQIVSMLANAYRIGSRNDVIFALSGFLSHGGFSLGAAETVIDQLCKTTGDEETKNRLVVVRKTYEKARDGEPITGRNELLDILERTVGLETANETMKDLSQLLNKKQDPMISQLNTSVRNELDDFISETVCYDPPILVVAHATKKQIIKCKIARYPYQSDAIVEGLSSLRLGDVIINALPEEITRYESPLNKDQIKYKITFVTPGGESFTTQPKPLDKIILDLKMRGLIYKPRIAEESLNAIINGAQRAQRVSVKRQIETPGFYYVDGKIVASNITRNQPSTDDIKRCAEFLNELVSRSKHPEILATEIKWGILAPFSFVLKQLSDGDPERCLPWLYLDGYTKTSKTTDGTFVLAIYRKQKTKVSLASANNVARLGAAISRETFPKLIDEAKLDPKIQSELIEAIKAAVQGLTARTKLSIASEPNDIPALCACIFTSNYQLPSDQALRRRFLNFHYPKDDKPTDDEISEFQSFLKSGINSLGTLGDIAINLILSNQELITNDNNKWQMIGKTILEEFYKGANLARPDWIDMIAIGNQIEDVEVEQEQIIRGFFMKKINDMYSKHYRPIVPWKEQQIDSVTNKNGPLIMRLNFCLDNQLISFMWRKGTNTGDILITNDILKELRDSGIDFIQTFTDLGRMLGTEIKPTKVDRKAARLIILSVEKLIGFIDPKPS
jgi:hypothetical protein